MEDAVIANQLKVVADKLDENTEAVHAIEREMSNLQGVLGERCKNRGERLARLENGRWTILGIIIAVSGAVGGAAAILVRIIGR